MQIQKVGQGHLSSKCDLHKWLKVTHHWTHHKLHMWCEIAECPSKVIVSSIPPVFLLNDLENWAKVTHHQTSRGHPPRNVPPSFEPGQTIPWWGKSNKSYMMNVLYMRSEGHDLEAYFLWPQNKTKVTKFQWDLKYSPGKLPSKFEPDPVNPW